MKLGRSLHEKSICTCIVSDMTEALWEVQLDVHNLNAATSPDGQAINLFYISDSYCITITYSLDYISFAAQ